MATTTATADALHVSSTAQPRLHGDHKLLLGFVTSGASVATATAATSPIDLVKTRMQLQQLNAGGKASNMFAMAALVVRQEGVLALFRGLQPAVLRGLLYGGLRLGMYPSVKQAVGATDGALGKKVLAGSLSGGLAAAVCSPTELIKTRLQANSGASTSGMDVVRDVVRREGIRGLWRGATPGLVRASVLTASQCATYDEVKRWVMAQTGWSDSAGTHLGTALITGLVSTTATSPVDVVKTNMFVGSSHFSGPLSCAAHIYNTQGARGFLRGWTANYARLGPQTVVTFVVAERLRKLAGLDSL